MSSSKNKQIIITGAIVTLAALIGGYIAMRGGGSIDHKKAIIEQLNNVKNAYLLLGQNFDKNKIWE